MKIVPIYVDILLLVASPCRQKQQLWSNYMPKILSRAHISKNYILKHGVLGYVYNLTIHCQQRDPNMELELEGQKQRSLCKHTVL